MCKGVDASGMLCTKDVEAGGLRFSAEVQKFATEERTVGTLRHLAAEGPLSRGGSQSCRWPESKRSVRGA